MPVEWLNGTAGPEDISGPRRHSEGDPPAALLRLWPHRSLPKRGFAAFIAITFALLLLPLIAVLGTPILWGLLPFVLGALALIWWALQRSYRDGEILEELSLWSDRALLVHRHGGRPPQTWDANPHWVSVHLHETGGRVRNYVTLRGAGREVEIGAFLSADERVALRQGLERALIRLRGIA